MNEEIDEDTRKKLIEKLDIGECIDIKDEKTHKKVSVCRAEDLIVTADFDETENTKYRKRPIED